MKKILLIMFMMALFIIVIGTTNTFAVTQAEAEELIKKVPDEISVELKESQFLEAQDEIFNKVKEITGLSDDELGCYINYMDYMDESINIKEANIVIYTDDYDYAEKYIKINYTNSSDWNEEDKNYVENIVQNTNFNRAWEYTINPDGTASEYKDKSNFTWNAVMGVDDIKAVEFSMGFGAGIFDQGEVLRVFLFKNDVFYQHVMGSRSDEGIIIIPEETEETEEAYINYAKPILEKIISDSCNDEYVEDGVTYRYEYRIEEFKRTSEDGTTFRLEIVYDIYIDNVYQETCEGGNESIRIAKENEFRCKLVPILQDVEIVEKESENYLKGKIKITETLYGYDTSVSKDYPPKILLIDDNSKEYETAVTSAGNDIYYFEIALNDIEMSKEYKIQARATDPDNKYPSNNIDASIETDTSIDFSREEVLVKSIVSGDIVKLSIKSNYTLGDVNGDGNITLADYAKILAHVKETKLLTEDEEKAADVNRDGNVTLADYAKVLAHVKETSLLY